MDIYCIVCMFEKSIQDGELVHQQYDDVYIVFLRSGKGTTECYKLYPINVNKRLLFQHNVVFKISL